jgi:hypothetical protein
MHDIRMIKTVLKQLREWSEILHVDLRKTTIYALVFPLVVAEFFYV